MEKRNHIGEFSASPYARDADDDQDQSGGSEEVLEEINIGKSSGYERVSEIEELREEEIKIDQFDHDAVGVQEDIVCVVIYYDGTDDDGSSSSNSRVSMDALLWTLTNDNGGASSSPSLFLLHVYPPLRFIPTPLGKLPISQANEEQRNIYLGKERTRRLQCLQPFLDLCSTSQPPVSADVIPIEGDKEAKSILEVISALQIRRLVLGIHPSSITTPKKQGGRQLGGIISGVAGRILDDAPQFCEVNIICQGKQLLPSFTTASSSPSPSSSSPTATSNSNIIKRISSINNNPTTPHPQQQLAQSTSSFGYCECFKPKTIS